MSGLPIGDSLEKRALRSVTIRLVPLLMALYFVNYLDRTNLGIAKAEISADLQLSATMFGLASGIFFIGYVLVEVPSNLALVRFGARRWLARIAVSWGVVAVAIAFAPNATTLLVLRFLLGVAEAGLFPGIVFYLSQWFPAAYRARIVGVFMLAVPIASAVGTPLAAWLIQTGHGVFGLAGWRFMVICVGLPAVILGVICWFYLTDRPSDATWLPDAERQWLVEVLAEEHRHISDTYDFPLRRALTSPRVWALALVYFGIAYGLYALAFFLPSIVAGFRSTFGVQLSLIQVGLITAVPYLFGAASIFPMVPARGPHPRTRLACRHSAVDRWTGHSRRAVSAAPHRRHGAGDDSGNGHLRRPAGFLGAALAIPCRRGGGGRYRPDQLAGKPGRIRSAVCHRGTARPHRNQQGRHVGRRAHHGGRSGPGGGSAGRSE